jgi:hypothetical protein
MKDYKKIILFCSIFFVQYSYSQKISNEYTEYTSKALNLMANENYLDATSYFTKAFAANGGLAKVSDRYKSASCWALLNNKDSAFFQLEKIAVGGKFKHYELLAEDINLKNLRTDDRWIKILKIMKKNSEE